MSTTLFEYLHTHENIFKLLKSWKSKREHLIGYKSSYNNIQIHQNIGASIS